MKKSVLCILVLAMIFVLAACSKNENAQNTETTPATTKQETTPEPTKEVTTEPTKEPTKEPTQDPRTNPTPGTTLLGDVDCDGKVDITDITTLAISLVDKKPVTGQAAINADVDKDGSVALTDLARIKQFVSKVIDKL